MCTNVRKIYPIVNCSEYIQTDLWKEIISYMLFGYADRLAQVAEEPEVEHALTYCCCND